MSKTAPDLSAICVSCGLCCNGTLYHVAPLTRAEYDNLIAVLDLELDSKGQAFLQLPCAALEGTACTRYETRMNICRDYHCGVLEKVADGTLDQEAAVAIVAQARVLAGRLADLMPPGGGASSRITLTQRVKNRYQQIQKIPVSERTAGDNEFLLAAGSFLIILARHYNLEKLTMAAASKTDETPVKP